jgi:hypothetical protein
MVVRILVSSDKDGKFFLFIVHNTRRANVVGFDHEAAEKRNFQ